MGGLNRVYAWVALVGTLASLSFLGRATADDDGQDNDLLYSYGFAIGQTLVYAVLLTLTFLLVRGLPARETLALRRPQSWPAALGLVVASYFTILVGAALLLTVFDAGDEQGLTPDEWDSSRAGAYAANFVVTAFLVPFIEELLYRGAGVTFLLRFGPVVAVAVTAVGFGLGHGLVRALPALVFFGIVVALLRLRTESVYPTMLVHCAFNATSLIAAVTT